MRCSRRLCRATLVLALVVFVSGCKSLNPERLKTPEALDAQQRLKQASEPELRERYKGLEQKIVSLKERKDKSRDAAEKGQLKMEIGDCVKEREGLEDLFYHLDMMDRLQLKALKRFEKGRDRPPEHAVTMSLMAPLNSLYHHAENRPETHRQLVSALKEEVTGPRVRKEATEKERRQVSSQAVYWLAETDGVFEDTYFISVLRDTDNSRDPDFTVRRSAFHALQPFVGGIVSNRVVRDKLMVALEKTKNDMLKSPTEAELIRGPLSWTVNELNTVPNVVDALETATADGVDTGLMVRLLEWDYRLHSAKVPSDEAVRERHASVVGGLFWHAEGEIRTKSRICLMTFDPVGALLVLAQHLQAGKGARQEDYVQFAAVYPAARQAASGASDRVKARYQAAFQAGFDALFGPCWKDVSSESREAVCGLMLENDAPLLNDRLDGITTADPAVFSPEQAIQQARYLGACRKKVGDDQPRVGKTIQALHTLLQYRDLSVRQQAVAQLSPEPPEVLLSGLCSVMQGIKEEKQPEADFLLTTWLASIERSEQIAVQGKPDLKPKAIAEQLKGTLNAHPYQCLTDVVQRPEFDLLCRCGAFLKERDPECLVQALLARVGVRPVEQSDARDIAYLGNAAASTWPRLNEALRKQVVEWHRSGVSDPSEDKAMLHSSILVQLGAMDDATAAKGPQAVKEMWRMINE